MLIVMLINYLYYLVWAVALAPRYILYVDVVSLDAHAMYIVQSRSVYMMLMIAPFVSCCLLVKFYHTHSRQFIRIFCPKNYVNSVWCVSPPMSKVLKRHVCPTQLFFSDFFSACMGVYVYEDVVTAHTSSTSISVEVILERG